jgi:DHA1 family multidrug resistance protein-like MFS transporter
MPAWRRTLFALWLAEFFTMLGISMFLPFLPLYLRELGVTEPGRLETMSGLIFAAPFLSATVATPVWGFLGDRHGRKLMVVRAALGLTVASALMGFATSVGQLFFLRLFQGAISGFIAAALALMASAAPRDRMGYALGTLQTAIPSGTIIGPLVGGFLADRIGARNVFFVTAALTLTAALVAMALVREAERPKAEGGFGRILDNYRLVFGTPQLRLCFLVLFGCQFALMSLLPVMALFVESLGAHGALLATTTGGVIAVTGLANVVAAPRWGRRSDRIGYRPTLKRALLGAAAFALPQGLVTGTWQLFLLRIPYGVFVGGVVPSVHAMISLRAPADRRAGTLGVTSTALMVGNLLGPLAGGAVAAAFGLRSVFFLSAVALVLVIAFLFPRIREPEREE